MNNKNTATELGQFIPLHYHYNMLNDKARMRGFKEALDHVVHPGAKVLELGGGTGVLSFFAAQKATKVWCVERNPELAATARKFLAQNPNGDKVEVIEADAFNYLPPEPVDVVICEMIHVAMLREKQIPVITDFKKRYLEKFGGPLPIFVPEALIQAVQPVEQCFDFEGYHAPTILFQDPACIQEQTIELAQPEIFQLLAYQETLPPICAFSGRLTIDHNGTLNALRFITKNVLAIMVHDKKTIDWFSQYLIIPLDEPITVKTGEKIQVEFSYPSGACFSTLTSNLNVSLAPLARRNTKSTRQRPQMKHTTSA